MITSASNKKVKDIVKLKENKNIKKYKKYIVEGRHLVEEALKAKVVEEVVVSQDFEDEFLLAEFSKEKTVVSSSVMKSISETITTQGIIAVCSIEEKKLDINKYKKVLLLDKVQDPGNLGTIVRTADAFSFDCIILGKGTTSLYGQKVIRSTQGSNFHIDCFDNIDLTKLIDEMDEFSIYATSLKTEMYLEDMEEISDKIAVVFGNEGAGVSEEVLEKVDNLLKIRMSGKAESLNVSVAAGIVLHFLSNKVK